MDINFYKDEFDMNYISSFPKEWIFDHSENKSGPYYCINCFKYGTIKYFDEIVFLGYCLNCAYYKYKNKRGGGFFGFFDEYDFTEDNIPEYLKKERNAILFIYKESKMVL